MITLFEIRPAPGVRVGRFTNLTDDLARSLKAEAIRIQAPVPGCDTVGVEIPNLNRSTVNFRELIQSEAFQSAPSLLTMALGKDIEGAPPSGISPPCPMCSSPVRRARAKAYASTPCW